MSGRDGVVVVGASAGGLSTVQALRHQGYPGPVPVVGGCVPPPGPLYQRGEDAVPKRIRALSARWEQSLRDRARMWPTSEVPLLNDLLGPYRHHYRRYLPVAQPAMIIAQSLPTWYNETHHPMRVVGS